MKRILLIAIVALLSSCEISNDKNNDLIVNKKAYNGEISIIEIDSCEYIKYEGYNKGSVCHKGNCKFCKQRKNNLNK